MTPRLAGWRTLWWEKRELFLSPKGAAYVRTENYPDRKVELFLEGRFVKLKRYPFAHFHAAEQKRRAAAHLRLKEGRRGKKAEV